MRRRTAVDPALDDAAKLAKAAELLRRSADAMHDTRDHLLAQGRITPKAFRENVATETDLRTQVSELVLAALKQVVHGATSSQADLEAAIERANAVIATLADIRKGLDVFAALIGLATSIAAMQPGPIVAALVALEKAVDTPITRRT